MVMDMMTMLICLVFVE